MKLLATTALLLLNSVSALKMELLDAKNAPSTGQEWISISPNQEAQMGDFSKYPPEKAARMRATFKRLLEGDKQHASTNAIDPSITYDQNFIDGTAAYDDIEQAWRYLGMFIDCNPEAELSDEKYGDDDGNGEEEHHSGNSGDTTCNRYVLYAVYIDPNYGGGGIGEYAFWDRHKQSWDTSACESTGSSCRKMDCHLPDTEFELLGFFKLGSTRDFMDQLFKHEGYCTWFPEEYSFMQGHARVWPRGCQPTYIDDLYIAIKPMPGGDWSIGIYMDEICTVEYTGRAMDIIEAYAATGQGQNSHDSGRYDAGDIVSLAENIDKWNSAMAFWKQCNPCRCYNIGNGQDATDYNDDDGNGRRRLQDGEGGDDAFVCNDDADYTNVNQCMKFYAKADLQVATFRNLALADGQGTMMEVDLANGYRLGSDTTVSAYYDLQTSTIPNSLLMGGFFLSLAVFIFGAAFFIFAWRTSYRKVGALEHPLVESDGVVA